jgi:hypothetical protein
MDSTTGGDAAGSAATPFEKPTVRLLSVPYFRQLDNESGQGVRECASSSCAMVAAYYGKCSTDDYYNMIRRRFGDTTSVEAQRLALEFLGLDVMFTQKASWATVERLLGKGQPVCLPYLHQGPVTAPRGFGHWCVGIGLDADQVGFHDPMGEPLLVSGGFVPGKSGRAIRGSRLNFGRRWSPEGMGNGWILTAWDPYLDPQ